MRHLSSFLTFFAILKLKNKDFWLQRLKNILFIIITIMLAVVIEAMTVTSLKEFNSLNNSVETLSSKSQSYRRDISLAEIAYTEKVTQRLRHMIFETPEETFKNINHREFIQEVYSKNNFMPLWFTSKGPKIHALDDLFRTIGQDIMLDERGNIYKEYQYLKQLFQSNNNRTLEQEMMLDMKLTSLYKSYLTFHLYGSIKWWNFQKDWVTYTPKYDISEMMLHYPLSQIVQATTPSSFGYMRLLQELKRLKAIQHQGGWEKIPNSSQLRYGAAGSDVKLLINRLRSSGDYTCAPSSGDNQFGPCLLQAVKRFQKRHGLYPNGTINRSTLNKINLSVEWKINKVLLNLDRIKRLPDQEESRYIMVNIPDFRLYYKENGQERLSMRVIVGDQKHHTPVFSSEISYIVLNPYWIMPDSIVKKEMIPEMLKNPNFLAERGYEVRMSTKTNTPTIDTSKIDWAYILNSNQSKKYKFMQPPGPQNALGKVKFKFPNNFHVYLHDTPNKKLFDKSQRDFSHGCIRVSEPYDLLNVFVKHERFGYDQTQRILSGTDETQLNLANRVPVHIVYLTAWVNSDGTVHYRNDIYRYDAKQTRVIY